MAKLTSDKLMTLEAYSKARNAMRTEVIAHKNNRNVMLGEHVRLMFEDEITIRYQVQEMLRVEKIFEEAGIQDEISAYNPLIPDGSNWKATMMIEYENIEERRDMLAKLIGIEDRVWMQIEGLERVYAIADEDLDRSRDMKTSAVHFLRLELSDEMKQELRQGAEVAMGIDHAEYQVLLKPLPDSIKRSLMSDLQD